MNLNKKHWLFCEACSTKSLIDYQDPNLVERCGVQGKIPQFNPDTKKTQVFESVPQKKMYKCPNCGRGVIVKGIPAAYIQTIKNIEEEKIQAKIEQEKLQRIEDAKPHQRKTDFTG